MKLVAIDLDGTLLSEDGSISSENRKAIYHAQEEGNIIAICSGRSLQDIVGILVDNQLSCPVVSGNGSVIYHNEVIQKFCLTRKEALEIFQDLADCQIYFEVYTDMGVFVLKDGKELLSREIEDVEKGDPDFSRTWADRQIDIQYRQHGLIHVSDLQNIKLYDLDIYKIFVFSFEKEKLYKFRNKLKANKNVSLTTSGWTKLEIGHKDVNKGNGILILGDHFGIPTDNIIAIGDHYNDIPMFEIAGISVAMGNANDKVKKHSTYVTKSFDQDGVAAALKKYCLK